MDENQIDDKQIEELIEKTLNEHIDEQMGDSADKGAFYEEVITEEILEKYDQDGQLKEEALEKVTPSVKAKVKDRIDGSRKKEIEQEVEEIENEQVGELDESKKAKIKGDIEEKVESEEEISSKEQAVDIEKEVQLAVYEQMMKEYYGLKDRINNGYNGRTLTGEQTAGNKADVELVMYQNYLRKIDTSYKRKYGSFIAQDDKNLAKLEEELRHADAKSEQKVNKTMSENIQATAVIIDKINEVTEEIAKINSAPNTMDEGTKQELEALQKRYISYISELNALNPSLLEIHEQMEQREEVTQFKDRVIGTEYERVRDKKIASVKATSLKNENDKEQDDIKEQINEQTHVTVEKSLDTADDLLEEFDVQIQSDPQKAMETLESAELIVDGNSIVKEDSRQQRVDEAKENYGEYSVQAECAAATRTDEEILKIDVENMKKRASELRDRIEEKRMAEDRSTR